MPQSIFAHLSNQRAAKKRAPYRTFPKHRTSAERGQENGQSNYRAPSCTMFYKAVQQNRNEVIASLLQKPSFSSPPRTALFFFSAPGEKEEGGASPTKELYSPKKGELRPQTPVPPPPRHFRAPPPKGRLLSAQMRVPFSPAREPSPIPVTPETP